MTAGDAHAFMAFDVRAIGIARAWSRSRSHLVTIPTPVGSAGCGWLGTICAIDMGGPDNRKNGGEKRHLARTMHRRRCR
jgi:hypothetical protein